jgi:heterogeneous nuclear ribonucleoprotein A1/A3
MKKVFMGGIPTSIIEDEFKDYFSKFGKIVEHQIMKD